MKRVISRAGIVPVIKIKNAEDAVPLARAIYAGGIDIIEITFRTDAAEEAIHRIAEDVPEITIGAGTVICLEQLKKAANAGAKFIVSPGLNPSIVRAAQEMGISALPGVVTPTEIETGLGLGLDTFKFFPAGAMGGVKTIKALAAPYGNVNFVPTGGIDEKNLIDYLKCPAVAAVGGSWIATEKMIGEKDFIGIEALTRQAKAIFASVRG